MAKADMVHLRLVHAICRHEHRFAKHISAVDDCAAAGVEVLCSLRHIVQFPCAAAPSCFLRWTASSMRGVAAR